MSEIIVLGLIPGTQIQITFLLWLLGIAAGGIYTMVQLERRKKVLRNWVVVTIVLVLTRLPARA